MAFDGLVAGDYWHFYRPSKDAVLKMANPQLAQQKQEEQDKEERRWSDTWNWRWYDKPEGVWLHGIGLASNKKRQEVARRLALSLATMLQECRSNGSHFDAEFPLTMGASLRSIHVSGTDMCLSSYRA